MVGLWKSYNDKLAYHLVCVVLFAKNIQKRMFSSCKVTSGSRAIDCDIKFFGGRPDFYHLKNTVRSWKKLIRRRQPYYLLLEQ